MELYQIKYFLAVSENLNFTRAAEQCNVSQPSLTRAIKKLEDELGGELFRRERSRTHLSELGHTMVPFLKRSLDSAIAAKEQAENYGRGDYALLQVGISSTIEIQVITPALSELTRTMPGVQLRLVRGSASDVMQQLEDGQIEICVTAIRDVTWERMDQWSLFTEDFVLIAGSEHLLGSKDKIKLSKLRDQKIISRPNCEYADALFGILQERNIQVNGHHELSDQSDLGPLVGKGMGVSVVPRSMKTPKGVTATPIQDAEILRTVSLFAVSGRRHSPAVAGFIRLLRATDWSDCECQPN